MSWLIEVINKNCLPSIVLLIFFGRGKMVKKTWCYIVGDIHGCFDELLRLEQKVCNHAKENRKKPLIISVGDLIDRGPCSKDVLEHFMEGKKGEPMISLWVIMKQ